MFPNQNPLSFAQHEDAAGCRADGCPVDECLCLHAEENALLEAGRDRIGDDAVIYCNTYVLPIPSQRISVFSNCSKLGFVQLAARDGVKIELI